ncbi:MAG: ABC transporter substrate-binding protein [Flavobacteriales bacterium]
MSKEGNSGKTVFRYNQAAGITSLDPAFARNLENIWAINQIFNGLVQMDSNLHVQPCIARNWDIDSTGTTYTFHLRKDVFFHDHRLFPNGKGRRVVADDFIYSFLRITDPDVASPGAWIFNMLDKSAENHFLGMEARDDTTLLMFLKHPFPPFLGILTMQYCSVVPKEIVSYYRSDFRRNPVGTGPFMFKNWKEGVKLVLVKNPGYFEFDGDKRLPYLDAVAISFIKERQLAFLDFLNGKYDFVSGLEALSVYKDEVLTLDGQIKPGYRGRIKMQKLPYLKTDYLGILIDPDIALNSPLKEKSIRKAINYGFDRSKMVRHLRNNIGRPATNGFIARGMPSYDESLTGYRFDPEKANEMLYLAGFPDGKGLPEIRLVTTEGFRAECEYIQHELAGMEIKIKLEVIEPAAYREMVAQSKVGFFRKSWVADYPDAENFLALFYSKNFSPSGPNYTHFKSVQFDLLYEKAMAEQNDSNRWNLYRQMDRIIVEEAPVVPLYYAEVLRFIQNDITGLECNPMNLLTLKRVRKK